MTETLNDRLDRMELSIKSLSEKIDQIKSADINKKQVINLIDDLSLQLKSTKPQERDISKEINNAIKRDITKEFITGLYRGK